MARRPSEVDPNVRAQLNAGEVESANLAEALTVDFGQLARAIGLDSRVSDRLHAISDSGISKRMAEAGRLVSHSRSLLDRCVASPSDTVRGWACFGLNDRSPDLDSALKSIQPLAADHHFGVREWAWLAVRPRIAEAVDRAIALLVPWTALEDENLRRFASESTRPRGVWCAHIPALKTEPQRGLAILEPLRADRSRYVQDSVGNWLNDAAKSRPNWVKELTDRWGRESVGQPTKRICKRARRSL